MKDVVNVEWGIDKKTGKRYVRYIYSDGTDSYNVGGTHAWRNNNPGNIHCSGDVEKYLKSVGCDGAEVAIFPDYETGNWAMARMLRRWARYKNETIESAITIYAPPEDGNPTEEYIKYVTRKTGLPRTKVILDMTDDEFNRFQAAMREFEDSTPGREILQFDSEGDVSYYERDYIKLGDGSSRDFSNYGPDIPVKYHGYIDFTPEGFKTNRRIPVVSSNVASIGYDENSYTLEVQFRGGGIYQYFNVPPQVFEEFINADSKGKFFHKEIKGIYEYSSVN